MRTFYTFMGWAVSAQRRPEMIEFVAPCEIGANGVGNLTGQGLWFRLPFTQMALIVGKVQWRDMVGRKVTYLFVPPWGQKSYELRRWQAETLNVVPYVRQCLAFRLGGKL